MLLVFLFLFWVFILFLCKLRINVKYINLSNSNNNKELKFDYIVKLGIFITSKIKLFEISFDREKIKEKDIVKRIKKLINKQRGNIQNYQPKELSKGIKKLDYSIDKFYLQLKIGTENTIITSFMIAIISTFVGIVMENFIQSYDAQKHFFLIKPIYGNDNIIDLKFSFIIYFSLIHALYLLFRLYKKPKTQKSLSENPA